MSSSRSRSSVSHGASSPGRIPRLAMWSATRAGPAAPAQSPRATADSARSIPIAAASRSIQASATASRTCDRPSIEPGPSALLTLESRTLSAAPGVWAGSRGHSASISSSRADARPGSPLGRPGAAP